MPAGLAGIMVTPALYSLLTKHQPAVGVALPREAPHRKVASFTQIDSQLTLTGETATQYMVTLMSMSTHVTVTKMAWE